jgi:hypothetical protein
MDIYVYYRAQHASSALLQARVQAMQTRLQTTYGVQAQLKRRPESAEGNQTWMEVYLDVPADFGAMLDSAVATANLLPLIEGARHIEYFLDCASCA